MSRTMLSEAGQKSDVGLDCAATNILILMPSLSEVDLRTQ